MSDKWSDDRFGKVESASKSWADREPGDRAKNPISGFGSFREFLDSLPATKKRDAVDLWLENGGRILLSDIERSFFSNYQLRRVLAVSRSLVFAVRASSGSVFVALSIFLSAVVFSLGFRYSAVSGGVSSRQFVWVVDRWSGSLFYCHVSVSGRYESSCQVVLNDN